MAYTYVDKPTSSTYSFASFEGKETFDDINVTYDSALTYYDGLNPAAYTSVAKPTSSTYSYVAKPI